MAVEAEINERAVRDRICVLMDKKDMIEEQIERDEERLRGVVKELLDLVNGN